MIEQNENAEEILIGTILENDEDYNIIKDKLTPDMFSIPVYRQIYKLISEGNNNVHVIIETLNADYSDIAQILSSTIKQAISSLSSVTKCANYIIKKHNYIIARDYLSSKLSSMSLANYEDTLVEVSEQIADLMPSDAIHIIKMSDLPSEYSEQYFIPQKNFKFFTGFSDLDLATGGIDRGDVCVIAARPACGKTAFALSIINNNSDRHIGYINLEMTSRQLYERQISTLGELSLGYIRRSEAADDETLADFRQSNEKLSEMTNTDIICGALSLADIESQVRMRKYDAIVIDYIGLIVPDRQHRGNRYLELTSISNGIKQIAMKYQIPIIALSQLNRESTKRDDKEPLLSELRDSGAIEQDASVVMMLWEHENPSLRNIKIEKCRNGQRYKTTLQFNGEHMQFKEYIGENPFV